MADAVSSILKTSSQPTGQSVAGESQEASNIRYQWQHVSKYSGPQPRASGGGGGGGSQSVSPSASQPPSQSQPGDVLVKEVKEPVITYLTRDPLGNMQWVTVKQLPSGLIWGVNYFGQVAYMQTTQWWQTPEKPTSLLPVLTKPAPVEMSLPESGVSKVIAVKAQASLSYPAIQSIESTKDFPIFKALRSTSSTTKTTSLAYSLYGDIEERQRGAMQKVEPIHFTLDIKNIGWQAFTNLGAGAASVGYFGAKGIRTLEFVSTHTSLSKYPALESNKSLLFNLVKEPVSGTFTVAASVGYLAFGGVAMTRSQAAENIVQAIGAARAFSFGKSPVSYVALGKTYRGVVLGEARPLVGLVETTRGFKYQLGMPKDVALPKTLENRASSSVRLQPETPIETKIIMQGAAVEIQKVFGEKRLALLEYTEKGGEVVLKHEAFSTTMPKGKVVAIGTISQLEGQAAILSLAKQVHGIESEFTSPKFKIELEGISPKLNEILTKSYKEFAERGMIKELYGSQAQKLSSRPEVFTRLPVDLDTFVEESMKAPIKETILARTKGVPENVRVSPTNPNIIEVQKPGQLQGRKIIELKGGEEALFERSSLSKPSEYFGFGFKSQPPLFIEKVPLIKLFEQTQRKGVSVAGYNIAEGRIGAKGTRFKEYGDFEAGVVDLIESARLKGTSQGKLASMESNLALYRKAFPLKALPKAGRVLIYSSRFYSSGYLSKLGLRPYSILSLGYSQSKYASVSKSISPSPSKFSSLSKSLGVSISLSLSLPKSPSVSIGKSLSKYSSSYSAKSISPSLRSKIISPSTSLSPSLSVSPSLSKFKKYSTTKSESIPSFGLLIKSKVRKEKKKGKTRAKRFEEVPLADLLSKTITEFRTGKPATQVPITRKTQRQYRERILEGGGMTFPTAEQVKWSKGKSKGFNIRLL